MGGGAYADPEDLIVRDYKPKPWHEKPYTKEVIHDWQDSDIVRADEGVRTEGVLEAGQAVGVL